MASVEARRDIFRVTAATAPATVPPTAVATAASFDALLAADFRGVTALGADFRGVTALAAGFRALTPLAAGPRAVDFRFAAPVFAPRGAAARFVPGAFTRVDFAATAGRRLGGAAALRDPVFGGFRVVACFRDARFATYTSGDRYSWAVPCDSPRTLRRASAIRSPRGGSRGS